MLSVVQVTVAKIEAFVAVTYHLIVVGDDLVSVLSQLQLSIVW